MVQIKALANADTATSPKEFVKVYLNNYLAGLENEDCIGELDSEVAVIKDQDGNKGIETNTCFISVSNNIGLSKTGNLPAKLKLSDGASAMLTDNVSVSDRLINGSIGTIKHLDRTSKPLCGTICVKFDDPKLGNSMKNRGFCCELKEYVPNTTKTTRFQLKKGKSIVFRYHHYACFFSQIDLTKLAIVESGLNNSLNKKIVSFSDAASLKN